MNSRSIISVALAFASIISAHAIEDLHSAQFTGAEGEQVTVRWGQPDIPSFGPHPTFASLDNNRDGFISVEEASAYPPLANEFTYADLNHDGQISEAEYAQWH